MAINRSGPGEAAVGLVVDGDARSSDEDSAEGGVMSYERHSAEGLIANSESRIDEKGKRGVETCVTAA